MHHVARRLADAWVLVAILGAALGATACDGPETESHTKIDTTLRAYQIQASTPTAEGLAFITSMADIHQRADALEGSARAKVLQEGLALPRPQGLPEAVILRLDMATRLAETLLQLPKGASRAQDLLGPMLSPERELPLDRGAARAVVVLGDAAAKNRDDALAAGSYARAIRMMSMLREEVGQ